ncbi:hypothetical protein X747_31760 [Mesorhizobium sp. LNJC384A00]|nr:hypothetical protein X747_31760 [Mesorhizobium sp. LNJC384A00]
MLDVAKGEMTCRGLMSVPGVEPIAALASVGRVMSVPISV